MEKTNLAAKLSFLQSIERRKDEKPSSLLTQEKSLSGGTLRRGKDVKCRIVQIYLQICFFEDINAALRKQLSMGEGLSKDLSCP